MFARMPNAAPVSKIGRTDSGAVNFCVARNGRDFTGHGQMGGLAHEFGLADPEALGERVKTDHLGLGHGGDAIRAVAIHPFHVMVLLAGNLYELAEKVLVDDGEFHDR